MSKKTNALEKEMEAKALLARKDFIIVQQHFGVSDADAEVQINHYFLDRTGVLEGLLVKSGSTLRARKKGQSVTLQLKMENDEGSINELPQPIDEQILQRMKTGGALPRGDVDNYLYQIGARYPYWYLGELETRRSTPTSHLPKDAQVFIDYSTYLGVEDWEIEIESSISKADATTLLQNLLDELGITPIVPIGETPKKVQRLYTHRKKSGI